MEKVVAAEVGSYGLKLFFHEGNSFRVTGEKFEPFILLSAEAEIPSNCTVKTLAGSGFFCRQAFFSSFEEYEKQLPELKKMPGVLVVRDNLQQALSVGNLRLFGNMEFDSLRRMHFAVSGSEEEGITAISIADTSGFTAVFSGGEEEIIYRFIDRINEFDPDVLENFNGCRHDLPLLVKRAKKLKITLACGRDGSAFVMRQSRYTAGEKQYSYQRFSLAGRHLVDLLHVVQLYDAAHRDLEELELTSLQEYFHIPGDFVPQIIGKLSEILLPAYFYRTREVPLGFQECILRGSGSALDALLTAEYLQHGFAIPLPEAPRPYAGALANMEAAGVFHNVRHCDVRSLYPSLLLMFNIAPARDEAGIFLSLLAKLRSFRLAAKDRARMLPEGVEKRQQEALQSSFKILINSFYGYLGFSQGTFNDFALAEKITAAGRELLGKLVEVLQNNGATVIEMDTDGIYFQDPGSGGKLLESSLNDVLPPGIELEFDAEYPAMFSYKAKNYALLTADDTIKLTGAALKSRALEGFQRKFILEIVSAKLHDDPAAIPAAYERWKNVISNRQAALEDLAKSEILSDSPENYRKKLASGSTRRSAAYELALASGRNFRAGDKVKFYVTGTKAKLPVVGNAKLLEDADPASRDENSAYYLAKLDALYETFTR